MKYAIFSDDFLSYFRLDDNGSTLVLSDKRGCTRAVSLLPYDEKPQCDCISRGALKAKMYEADAEAIDYEMLVAMYEKLVNDAQAVEPERPQGEWEDVICEKGGFYHATCSNCKIRNDIPPVDFAHFCPNCGADMRGGAE